MARGPDTRNPYTPDSGVKPPALTGRDRELEHLRSIITQVGKGGTERHVLITGLSDLGDGPQPVGAVATLLGRTTSLSPRRDELMRSAVIYSPRRGYVDFTVPHCARFVRRHYQCDA
jgi:hypothetical protein